MYLKGAAWSRVGEDRRSRRRQEVGGAKPLAPGAKLISAAFILSSIPEK